LHHGVAEVVANRPQLVEIERQRPRPRERDELLVGALEVDELGARVRGDGHGRQVAGPIEPSAAVEVADERIGAEPRADALEVGAGQPLLEVEYVV
jgi:hypothetical protein